MKGIVSFTIDTKVYEKFQEVIPSNKKSKTVEKLIIQFLNRKGIKN